MNKSTNPSSEVQIERPKAAASGVAVVKAVLSGDLVVLMGGAQNGAIPPERQLAISGISSPRFARGKSGEDEVSPVLSFLSCFCLLLPRVGRLSSHFR